MTDEAYYMARLSESELVDWLDLFGEMPRAVSIERHYTELQQADDTREILEMRLEMDGRAEPLRKGAA